MLKEKIHSIQIERANTNEWQKMHRKSRSQNPEFTGVHGAKTKKQGPQIISKRGGKSRRRKSARKIHQK